MEDNEGHYNLERLGHDHLLGLPLCLAGSTSQHQGEPGQEDED